MASRQNHFLLQPPHWSKRIESAACAGELHRADAAVDAVLRAYVRAFATPLVLIALLVLASALAACFVPPG